MKSHRCYQWKCRDRLVELGNSTHVMGILNVTPDSFSDGGKFHQVDTAVEHALRMVSQGAELIDIGGESTRPGAEPVPVDEEIRRVVPVVKALRDASDTLISVDTMKAATARAALDAGADIVNDVSALMADPEMSEVVKKSGAGVVLMHMRGNPKTMQQEINYSHVVNEVIEHLKEKLNRAEANGIERSQMMIDPGIGFGKTPEHNLELLNAIPKLSTCGSPILIGASRKSFIGSILGRSQPENRLAGSLGAAAWAALAGAHVLRVHDVLETCDVCRLLDRLSAGGALCI